MQSVREGDTWLLSWPEDQVAFAFEHILDDGWRRVTAEVTVESLRPGLPSRIAGPFVLGLADLEQQERQARILSARGGWTKEQWQQYLLSACSRVLLEWRKPDEAINLKKMPDSGPVEFLLPGMLQLGETNILYGDGESAKSLFALLLVICLSTGTRVPGLGVGKRAKALVLDWETNPVTVATRVRRICAGLGIDPPDLIYHRMYRPISDALSDLKAEIDHDGYNLILIDSIGFATRGSLVDDGVARNSINCIRELGNCTKLVVGHIPAADARREQGPSRPFGSVWFWNGVRQAWEVRKSEDSTWDCLDIGLYHRKSNDGARLRDLALSVSFDGIAGPIRFSQERLSQSSDLPDYQRITTRLRDLMRGGAASIIELATELNASVDSVEHSLNQMADVIRIDDGRVWKYGLRAN